MYVNQSIQSHISSLYHFSSKIISAVIFPELHKFAHYVLPYSSMVFMPSCTSKPSSICGPRSIVAGAAFGGTCERIRSSGT